MFDPEAHSKNLVAGFRKYVFDCEKETIKTDRDLLKAVFRVLETKISEAYMAGWRDCEREHVVERHEMGG